MAKQSKLSGLTDAEAEHRVLEWRALSPAQRAERCRRIAADRPESRERAKIEKQAVELENKQ
jgi:hypothetical protein